MNIASRILFEDNHLLVVDKPPLLATMGAEPGQPSLLDLCKDYLKRKYHKPGNVYLGVVSRLDAFVTGVIVFARTSKAAGRLSEQFRNHSVDKRYWAIIPGKLATDVGYLTHYVYKDDARRRMFVAPSETKGKRLGAKRAELKYRKLAEHGDRWLVEVELLTGRKHQIRVQFSHAGCPIVGDKKYGSRETFEQGIALHSRSLNLDHPTTKKRLAFEAMPPKWWQLSLFGI